MSHVKDPSLAKEGRLKIEYAETHMGALLKIREEYAKTKVFAGLHIGMALHVTKETAVLIETLQALGATVAICSCNPLSTQDDVAAALAESGTEVYAYKGETHEDYYSFLKKVIETKPNITIDDGCDLISEIHKNYPALIAGIIGGCEETTTGIMRLRAMEKDNALKYPVIAVNDNRTKHLTDNYYGTGQSTWDGILRSTNVLIAGKTVVISGYGDCGKGVALRARGMGATVIITEVDAFRALQATFDGLRVMKLADASKLGDIFITVTGNKRVISEEMLKNMKSGAILANAGHFNTEIDIEALEKIKKSKQHVRPFLEEYKTIDGRKLYLIAEGRLCNLGAAEGHPSEVMALSFSGQVLACNYLVTHKGKLEPKVHRLPDEIDDYISKLQLTSMGIEIDELTPEQRKYLASWEEGT
ncbi:MAG: Adenosylhomocysteinase [Candidatus Peregrinibacteria bacterium GW2011_GWA2_47_7]|nr:MAG: Adenosylhomocysteinase [Candidatus Peregrinibacteria bacterium GW2011_GWA2_47_7]